MLKQNHAQRNCIKRDLLVLIFYLLSIGSAVILDEHIAFENIDILFCKMLNYCEQFLNKYWESEPLKEMAYLSVFCAIFSCVTSQGFQMDQLIVSLYW